MEIVKIQVPLNANAQPEALIYNESRDLCFMIPIDESLKRWMKGRDKVFFEIEYLVIKEDAPFNFVAASFRPVVGHVVRRQKDRIKLDILKELPDQGW